MQREQARRGFTIHQKVVLELDFAGALWGYTELRINPTTKDLKAIHLHSRQCVIQSVTVASYPAEFVHYDAVANLNVSNPSDCHRFSELKRKLYSALAEGDEGELSIAIPKEVPIRMVPKENRGHGYRDTSTPEPQTPGPSTQANQASGPEYEEILIKIVYSLRNPVDGVQFVMPTDSYPYRIPHVYTTTSSADAARCWIPCVDSVYAKCAWEFEFIVPSYLEEREEFPGLLDDEFDYPDDRNRTVVVCSGDLVEQVAHPNNSSKTIFLFSLLVPTSAQHIAFSAGPFHVLPLPPDAAEEISSARPPPLMHAFCLPGQETHLATTVSFLRGAMNFYQTHFNSYPFGSYKLVFVEELPTQRFDSATLTLVSTDLLHGPDAIDQVYEARLCLSHALACQWMGINMQQKNWSDLWLVNGLGLYMTGLFLCKLFGNNEYRFRLKKDMERVVELDRGAMPPICRPNNPEPPDAAAVPFVNLKAPLVLHILDRKLGKSGTSVGLPRVLNKIFLEGVVGDTNLYISTHSFLRICRKVSGVDLRTFADQWIYGSGCPTFGFSAVFNRKKMAVEISMQQECPAYIFHEKNDRSKIIHKPVPFFEGQMTIRIHEADGTPYEHVLDIRSPYKRYEVPFNTKYKRVRRNTKRYLARQAAAQAAAEGDAEAAEAMGMIDMGFGLEIWENEKERENWKVADWTEDEEQTMSGATYEWIRMDADFEWIATIGFEQPDFMWVSQLQRDRDVVAQLEAVRALSRRPTAIVSSTLTKSVLVANYFYRIRCEAALALVHCAIQKLEFLGLFHLFKLFLRYCYEPETQGQDLFNHTYVPRANDFTDVAEYFVRKTLLKAISRVRFADGKTPVIVRRFLIDQLRYNDNTSNPYSDAFYICTNITALAAATLCTTAPERGELTQSETIVEQTAEDIELMHKAIAEVDRYRNMDRLIPSYHNVVTIAALEFNLMLSTAGMIPVDSRVFFPLTREGNATQVRMLAFDALLMTKWYTPKIMKYVFAIIASDPSRVIRRHVAINACHSLALLVYTGEMRGSSKDGETLLIEEDGSIPEKSKESKRSDVELMLKVLRKDKEVGKNEILREFLMPLLLSPDVDQQARWAILKLADLVLRGGEEAPPKITIQLPPTPVTEVPPSPVVRIQPVAQRILKTGPTSSPAQGTSSTPKIKLVPSGLHRETTSKPPVVPQRKGSFVVPPLKRQKQEKEKDKKPVPRPQSSGMSVYDLGACRNALKKLQAHKRARLFLQPVDPVRDRAPDYFKIIKNPMDLSTISAKLNNGLYKDRAGFEADFRLMVNNSKTYNSPGTYVHGEAVALEQFFDKQWARISKTVESHKNAHPSMPPPPAPPPATPVVKAAKGREPITKPQTTSTPGVKSTPTPSARPTIKLKIGGGTHDIGPVNGTDVRIPSKPKKPPAESTPSKPPPPSKPVVKEPKAPVKLKTNGVSHNGNNSKGEKRKKTTDGIFSDDDILASAAPLKKRPSPLLGPTPGGPSTPSQAPPQPQRNGSAVTLKLKAPKPAASPPPLPRAQPSPPSEPIHNGKGKEPEGRGASAGPRPKPPASMPINIKRCKDAVKSLQKIPDSAIFARPVDPVADGCPTYYDEIKNPMDFGTINQRLNQNKYETMEDFKEDVMLVFRNCRKFNPPGTFPYICADNVEAVFIKEWARVMEKKLEWGEKRSLQGVLSQLLKEDISFVFRVPVDPVLLEIPTYFDVIPKKDARDLGTIKQKLDTDKYDTVDALRADFDLMINNALLFNGVDSEVGQIAMALKKRFYELWTISKSKKRKEAETNGQPTKKLKLK